MGLVQQIRTAQLELGWSTQQLLERSGLSIERSNLHRKLTGKALITVAECEALAAAIRLVQPGFRLEFPAEEAAG